MAEDCEDEEILKTVIRLAAKSLKQRKRKMDAIINRSEHLAYVMMEQKVTMETKWKLLDAFPLVNFVRFCTNPEN
jgi:hypothetical protein